MEEEDDEIKLKTRNWSEDEVETSTTEVGYDADTESNDMADWHKGNIISELYNMNCH